MKSVRNVSSAILLAALFSVGCSETNTTSFKQTPKLSTEKPAGSENAAAINSPYKGGKNLEGKYAFESEEKIIPLNCLAINKLGGANEKKCDVAFKLQDQMPETAGKIYSKYEVTVKFGNFSFGTKANGIYRNDPTVSCDASALPDQTMTYTVTEESPESLFNVIGAGAQSSMSASEFDAAYQSNVSVNRWGVRLSKKDEVIELKLEHKRSGDSPECSSISCTACISNIMVKAIP